MQVATAPLGPAARTFRFVAPRRWRLPRCHAGLPLEIKPSQPPHGGWLRGATVTEDGYVLARIPSV
jgi:hypothetical protein